MTLAPADSRELGLVLAHRLLGLEDLHYGLWAPDLEVTPCNLPRAQQSYTDYLVDRLPGAGARVLDVGCGTGSVLARLLEAGYAVDALSPSPALTGEVRRRLVGFPGADTVLFETRYESLDPHGLEGRYDVVLFSESFQYVQGMADALEKARRLLKAGGQLVISDVFHADNAGNEVIRGGHSLAKFESITAGAPLQPVSRADLTTRVSPTIQLLHTLMTQRVGPAADTLGAYLRQRHPLWAWLGAQVAGARLRAWRERYLGDGYTQQAFERHKRYLFLVFANAASRQ